MGSLFWCDGCQRDLYKSSSVFNQAERCVLSAGIFSVNCRQIQNGFATYQTGHTSLNPPKIMVHQGAKLEFWTGLSTNSFSTPSAGTAPTGIPNCETLLSTTHCLEGLLTSKLLSLIVGQTIRSGSEMFWRFQTVHGGLKVFSLYAWPSGSFMLGVFESILKRGCSARTFLENSFMTFPRFSGDSCCASLFYFAKHLHWTLPNSQMVWNQAQQSRCWAGANEVDITKWLKCLTFCCRTWSVALILAKDSLSEHITISKGSIMPACGVSVCCMNRSKDSYISMCGSSTIWHLSTSLSCSWPSIPLLWWLWDILQRHSICKIPEPSLSPGVYKGRWV